MSVNVQHHPSLPSQASLAHSGTTHTPISASTSGPHMDHLHGRSKGGHGGSLSLIGSARVRLAKDVSSSSTRPVKGHTPCLTRVVRLFAPVPCSYSHSRLQQFSRPPASAQSLCSPRKSALTLYVMAVTDAADGIPSRLNRLTLKRPCCRLPPRTCPAKPQSQSQS